MRGAVIVVAGGFVFAYLFLWFIHIFFFRLMGLMVLKHRNDLRAAKVILKQMGPFNIL